MNKFNIGDKVHNISLFPKNMPITGGFPWSRESIATIVDFHENGTKWYQWENTGPNTYMIEYEKNTQWGTEWAFDSIYPIHEQQLQLVELDKITPP